MTRFLKIPTIDGGLIIRIYQRLGKHMPAVPQLGLGGLSGIK